MLIDTGHPWFHCSEIPDPGGVVTLDAREAQHATGSRRRASGDGLTLFDGTGVVATARLLESDSKREVTALIEQRAVEPAPVARRLAAALPKGDRQSVMLGMATQLGMTSFIPLECARAVAQPSGGFEGRARRLLVEACKQARRAHVPTLEPPTDIVTLTEAATAAGQVVVLAHPGGRPLREIIAPGTGAAGPLVLLVGPEGGFETAEVEGACGAGAVAVDLGAGVLRVETAAIALLACASMLDDADIR